MMKSLKDHLREMPMDITQKIADYKWDGTASVNVSGFGYHSWVNPLTPIKTIIEQEFGTIWAERNEKTLGMLFFSKSMWTFEERIPIDVEKDLVCECVHGLRSDVQPVEVLNDNSWGDHKGCHWLHQDCYQPPVMPVQVTLPHGEQAWVAPEGWEPIDSESDESSKLFSSDSEEDNGD